MIDVRLVYCDHVVCPGGDHPYAIRLDPRDLIRLSEPRVGDICEHDRLPQGLRGAAEDVGRGAAALPASPRKSVN